MDSAYVAASAKIQGRRTKSLDYNKFGKNK